MERKWCAMELTNSTMKLLGPRKSLNMTNQRFRLSEKVVCHSSSKGVRDRWRKSCKVLRRHSTCRLGTVYSSRINLWIWRCSKIASHKFATHKSRWYSKWRQQACIAIAEERQKSNIGHVFNPTTANIKQFENTTQIFEVDQLNLKEMISKTQLARAEPF